MSEARKTVTLEGLEDLVQRVGKGLPRVARTVLQASLAAMVRDVTVNRMSGQYLGVDTGKGRQSVRTSGHLSPAGDRMRIYFGSPLGYIRAHEEGYTGPVQVREHTRRMLRPTHYKGKVSKRSAKEIKAALRKGRKPYAHVRAHTRQVRIRARRFIRDTLLQEAGDLPRLLTGGDANAFTRRLIKGLRIVTEQNRFPRVGELGVR